MHVVHICLRGSADHFDQDAVPISNQAPDASTRSPSRTTRASTSIQLANRIGGEEATTHLGFRTAGPTTALRNRWQPRQARSDHEVNHRRQSSSDPPPCRYGRVTNTLIRKRF